MGRLAPAQGGVLTSNVLGIDVSQGLQADHAGNTDATSAIRILQRARASCSSGFASAKRMESAE